MWDGVRQPRNQSEPTGDDVDAASTEKCAELKNEPAAKGDASRKQKGRSAAARHSRTGSLSDRFSSLMRRATFPLTKVSEEPPTTNNKSSVNGPEGGKGTSRVEPRVLHGHTLTKEVPFRDVCYAIRDSAFVHSHLPVIVSLEVHANLEQQEIMVEIMRETWAGLLVDLTADLDTLTCKQPRLADLDRKILVKVKWAPPMAAATECAATEGAATAVDAPLDQVTTSSTPEEQDSPDDTKVPTSSPSKKPKSGGIANALSRLAVYTRAYHFSGFSTPGNLNCSVLCTMRSELKFCEPLACNLSYIKLISLDLLKRLQFRRMSSPCQNRQSDTHGRLMRRLCAHIIESILCEYSLRV